MTDSMIPELDLVGFGAKVRKQIHKWTRTNIVLFTQRDRLAGQRCLKRLPESDGTLTEQEAHGMSLL